MKKVFPSRMLLFFLIILNGGCASFKNQPDDYWFARDKVMHFGVSAVISGGTTAVLINDGRDGDESAAIGFGMALVFGIGKESYDAGIKKTYWSWKDFVWDIVGAGAGALTVSAVEK